MTQENMSPVEWRSQCPISSGLDILGDKWSLLIVRDLITHGTRTYTEFAESQEQISTNILADRLKLLAALGIIQRVDANRGPRNNAFQLTKRGKDLRKVLEALARWSYSNMREFHPEIVSID